MASYNNNIFTKGTVTYSDFDMSFKSNPLTGDLRKKTDVESIKQSLKTLLYTNFGERPFRPYMSGGLTDLLFEPLDQITTLELEKSIRTVISNWEPRVSIVSLSVTENSDRNELEVSLKFDMVNTIAPQSINIILKRVR